MNYDMPQKPLYELRSNGNVISVGSRIVRIRKSLGLTQEEIAVRIGITQTLFSSYERGRLKISAEMLGQIAIALKVTADELLGLAKPEKSNSINGKMLRRLKQIEALPIHKRRVIISNIDIFLKGALGGEKARPGQEAFAEFSGFDRRPAASAEGVQAGGRMRQQEPRR